MTQCLPVTTKPYLVEQALCDRLAMFWLKQHVNSSESLTTDVNGVGSIEINGTALLDTTNFGYLRFGIALDGSQTSEVDSRVVQMVLKGRSSTRQERIKSNIYRAVVRPVALYGTRRHATKEVETRSAAMETKMLNHWH